MTIQSRTDHLPIPIVEIINIHQLPTTDRNLHVTHPLTPQLETLVPAEHWESHNPEVKTLLLSPLAPPLHRGGISIEWVNKQASGANNRPQVRNCIRVNTHWITKMWVSTSLCASSKPKFPVHPWIFLVWNLFTRKRATWTPRCAPTNRAYTGQRNSEVNSQTSHSASKNPAPSESTRQQVRSNASDRARAAQQARYETRKFPSSIDGPRVLH